MGPTSTLIATDSPDGPTIKVAAIKCHKCGDTIYSRARHDFRWCSCKAIAIDGGTHYTKITFKTKPPKPLELTIQATQQDLLKDWDYGTNKYGLIKQAKTRSKKNAKKNS